MTTLDDLFDQEFASPEAQLALELAREDQQLLEKLVKLRRDRMTQGQMAEALGVTQATISSFERIGNDPHLSKIRRYARALGVMVRHHIDDSPHDLAGSSYLSHVDGRGIHAQPTATAVAKALRAWPDAANRKDVAEPVAGALR